MTRTNLKAGLVGLVLAGALAACDTMGGPNAAAAAGVSNPTNGGPAFVGGAGR